MKHALKRKRLIGMGIVIFCMILPGCSKPAAEPAAEPTYEIHLLMDPDLVLDEDHLPTQEVCTLFGIEDRQDYKLYEAAYLDTPGREFDSEGWINRFRMKKSKPDKEFELTYKKRYPVDGEDIDSALRQAVSDGFDLSDGAWSQEEIDWGLFSMTLSIAESMTVPADGAESISDLSDKDMDALMAQNMPAIERDWKSAGWGEKLIEKSLAAGPLCYKKYKSDYSGHKIVLEIWEIKDGEETSYVPELSAKIADRGEAAECREELIEALKEQGWLLEKDELKTRQVLDAYLP